MIGSFRYEHQPTKGCVAVRMSWASTGERQGLISVPPEVEHQIEIEALPSTDEPLSIDGALAYALVLCIRGGTSLRLSGDLSVWPEEWGQIIFLNENDANWH